MNVNRMYKANDRVVEEFYWAGKYVVYIDGFLSPATFEWACDHINQPDTDPLPTSADVY